MRNFAVASLWFCACVGACSSAPPTDTLATDGCDPLVPQQCGLPFPSNVWLADDATTPTGHHVQFGPKTLPTQGGNPTDPAPWTRSDGFSPGMASLAFLPGASPTGLPDENHLDASITTASPDRKSTRLNSSHSSISYAVFCLKK